VMPERLVEAVNKVRDPFNVNTVAQVAAYYSLDATDEVARRAHASSAVLRMVEITDPIRVPDSVAACQLARAISGAVVNEQQLPVGVRLVKDAVHCLCEKSLSVQKDRDDRHERLVGARAHHTAASRDLIA